MSRSYFFLVLMFSMLVFGCSEDKDKSAAGAGADGPLVTQEDRRRWPETGEYTFSFTFNGCTDSYTVNGKAEYCVALTDQSRSKCNTSGMRERAYLSDCGSDFEPRNLNGYEFSGFDSYLQRSCVAAEDGPFRRLGNLCISLKNEARHQGCHWAFRRSSFSELNCEGSFSPEPQRPEPPTTTAPTRPQPPTPDPGPAPSPSPAPGSSMDDLVSEFNAIGIEVGINEVVTPGERLSQAALENIAGILLRHRDKFVDQKELFRKISLTTFTSHNIAQSQSRTSGFLLLDARLTEDEFLQYMSINKVRIDLLQDTGVFVDVGVDLHGGSLRRDIAKELSEFSDHIGFFVANTELLKSLNPLIEKVSLEQYNSIQFFDNTLELKEETYRQKFSELSATLKPFAVLARSNVVFKGFVFSDGIEKSDFLKLSAWLARNIDGMHALSEYFLAQDATSPLQIELNVDSAFDFFYSSLGKLTFYVGRGADFSALDELVGIAVTLQTMNVKLEVSNYSMDKDFVSAMKVLQQRQEKLISLKGKVTEIVIWSADTSFSYNTLYVSGRVKLSDLDRVLNNIR